MYYNFLFHYGIPCYNKIVEKYDTLCNTINYIKNTLYSAVQSDKIVFFAGNPHAYIASYVQCDKSSVVVWKYSRYSKLFYMYNCAVKDRKRIPILSANLVLDGKEIYNLDSFIEEVRIDSSNVSYPTPNQFLEAWAYTSGYVLDRRENYILEYIDTDLNTYEINPLTDDFIFNKIKRV